MATIVTLENTHKHNTELSPQPSEGRTTTASELSERGNAVAGLVWGTALSVPLWGIIGLAVRGILRLGS